MDIDHQTFEYIFNHVIYPPRLPQSCDEGVACRLGRNLLLFVRTVMNSYIAQSSPHSHDIWKVAVNMVDSWLQVDPGDALCVDSLTQAITHLKSQGAVALFLKAQNCGWIAYHDPDASKIILDAFEASPTSAAVLASKGRLVRSFPGQSVAIPDRMAHDSTFCSYLADSLSRLSTERVVEMEPKTMKARTSVSELRDTVHPGLVTEGLMAQLLVFGCYEKAPSFEKRIRDDVNWNDCNIPWRRSPHWMVLRIALQTILQRAFPGDEGRVQYKNFMLYLVAEIEATFKDHTGTPDQLAIIRAKIGRRIYKLGEKVYGFVADHARSSERDIMDRLRAVQLDSTKSDKLFVQPNLSTSGNDDLKMSLKRSRGYLQKVVEQMSPETTHSIFYPRHAPQDRYGKYGLPVVTAGDVLSLAYMELWVEQCLGDWTLSAGSSEDHCCALADLFHEYAETAGEEYAAIPEEMSSMFLVLLELWMAIDVISTSICPLLKDYQPEIPPDFLEPLLLPKLSQMRRARKIEEHIRSRYRHSFVLYPRILGDRKQMSFTVRYFDASDEHKRLRDQIEQRAEEEQQQKRREWRDRSEWHRELVRQAGILAHYWVHDEEGARRHPHDGSCKKCDLEREANGLQILVYEWPLPMEDNAAKATVFELAVPRWFASWRDTTWKILHDARLSKRTPLANVKQHLLAYREVERFSVNRDQKLSLASATKSWMRTHYKYQRFPVDFDGVSRPNGLQLKLWDRVSNMWVGDCTEHPILKRRCTSIVPPGPYSHLQYAVESFQHTENRIIADQRNCHADMSFHEFIAFGCLRAGERTQWHNIMRELASSTLSLNESAVGVLLTQAAWELGSYNPGTELREAHQVVEDSAFGARLVEVLEHRLHAIESNWNEHNTLYVLAALGLRLHSLSGDLSVVERVSAFLRECRHVAMRWCQGLNLALDSMTGRDSSARGMLILKICWICQLTYAVELQRLPSVFTSHEDLKVLAWSSMVMHHNTPQVDKLPAEMKTILVRSKKLLCYVEKRARQLVEEVPSGLNAALNMMIPNIKVNTPWRFYSGDLARWAKNQTATASFERQQEIHFDLLTGELIVDREPPGRLPADYTRHSLFKRIFGLRTINVIPSNLPGSKFMSTQLFGQFQVHFGMNGEQLVVKAQNSSRLLQLIPHDKLLDDFPAAMVTECVHWLDLKSSILEFCPLSEMWQLSQDNWHMPFDSTRVKPSVMRRGGQMLVDVRSNFFREVTSVLQSLDNPEHIQVIHTEDGSTEIEMIRLHLRFFVNKDGTLESQEFGAIVDQNQDLGCLYGLTNKLVLLDPNGQNSRIVLVPYGRVDIQRKRKHARVTVMPPDGPSVKYFSYSLDPHLQTLRFPSGILSGLYLAYLHAVTAFVLPDPATNRTGTDEALRILRQARMKSSLPLDSETATVLKDIAGLTPRREYYGGLKTMQVTSWSDRLGEMAQHDDFGAAVQEIVDHSMRFSGFHSTKGETIEINFGCQDLLDRARYRHAQFRCSEFGGSDGYPTAISSPYQARDQGQPDGRSRRVYEVAALVRDWPALTRQCDDLSTRVTRWNYVCINGYDLRGQTYNDHLQLSVQDAWCRLYNLCRESNREKDSYRLLSLFCTFAFGEKFQLSDIRCLLTIAFSGHFGDLLIPGRSDPETSTTLQLHMGQELKKVEIRRAIEKHYTPFEYRHTGRSVFQQQEQERRAQLEEYKQRKNTEVDSCWEAITAQWPCERPVISGESLSPYLNREGILKDCGSLFTCWYRNRQFLDFIQQVQNRLNAIQASQEPLVEPLPCPPARGPVHHALPFQPPTLLELIRSSAPTVVPPDLPSLICPRPRIPQFCHTKRHSALRSLIHLSFDDASVHRREYKDDLLQSVGALERTVLPYRPTAIPITRDILSDYQASLRQQRDVVWSSFVSALTSTESSWKAVGGATLWPSITVAAVLSLLAVDKWPSVPECWKHAILMFAKVIASLRRCDRLLTFFDKGDINGFTKEAETAECEGWELANNPDWLLFEIENNLTIRPQQAEIAQRMIGSESEGNFALQLNMGEGKTSVITPMVASRLADYPQIPRIVVLKPLLRQSVDLLSQRLGGLLNRPIYHIPFSRNTPMNENSVDHLQSIYRDCQDQKGILIALPEQILSFRLIGLDMAHESNNLARRMIQLEKWLQYNCRNIVDECDEILDPRFQLIYAMGNQQPMDSHSDRWEITQAVLGVVEEEAIKLHSEEPNSLDIECNGVRYPIFHFLKAKTVDVLLQNTLEVICKKQLPGIPFDSWGHSVRESAFRFIRYVDTTDSDQAVLRGAFGSSDIVFRRLLILRGLFAHRILRFTLGLKRWLVDYGLHLPRCLLAVPFRAKGVPSENAEFGHPDVTVTLTCMSYYYEGLTVDQVRHCFGILTKENDPEAEYQRWIARCSGSLPDGLHSQSGVNLEDTQSFLKYLYPHLQYQKALVDFYLSHVAFPRGAKEFPRKLSTSAWDIPSQSSLPPTTGFSGTNDNRSLIPRSMPQRDLPRLRHTSAMVLDHLMLEENRQCILAQDSTGRQQLHADELITLVNRQEPPARVIIDVGAQILERSNRSVAENWLSTLPPNSADAAVFYDFNDEAVVVDRGGYTERLLTSTFRRQMDRCLVFLDQHHARGVDLKLPLNYRAAITLGPRLTKDRLVQGKKQSPPDTPFTDALKACSRMRELGNGQSVMFFIPPEVIHSMTPTHGHFTSCDVIQWALNQTCQTLESFRPLWAWQGLHHHRRTRLWEDLLADENTLREIVLRMQEPEAQTLLQLYAPWEAKQSTLENDPDLDHSSADVQYLLDMWQNVTEGNARDFRIHEEQEREIAVEVEREQQVCRPRLAKPLDHSLHPDIQHYAKHGRFQFGASSKAICSAFESFRQTSAGQFPFLSKLGPHLYATLDFTQTIREVAGTTNDEFLKPVLWILSSSHSPNLVILSQYEVNKLLPDIRATENTALHIYSPRTSKGMRRFNDLDFFTAGKANTNCPPLPEISRDLELFAGSLYFDSFPDYQHFRHFLGLKTGYVGDVPEDSVSPEGFVDEEARQVVGWPVRSPFRSNPLPFLSAVFDIRGKGHGYLQTHVGSLIKGMTLSEDEF